MAGLADLDRRIAQLEETAETIRELVREAHAATKDLRHAIRDANEVLSSTPVMEKIDHEVALGLERYANEIKRAQTAAVEQVGRTFTELANVHLYGNPDGKGSDVFTEIARARRDAGGPT